MPTEVERKLAAILSGDVVGYSRLDPGGYACRPLEVRRRMFEDVGLHVSSFDRSRA